MLAKGVHRSLAQQASHQDPDFELVRRMAQGDESALAALYATYQRKLYAFAYRVTGDADQADEVLQECLIAVWQSAHTFRGEARVLTWLLGILHHKAVNAVRKKALPMVAFENLDQPFDKKENPSNAAVRKERRQILEDCLRQLKPEHRAVLDLVFFQGLNLAEVAEVCKCPEGTVKSRLSYAKIYLRGLLVRAGLGLEDIL